MKKYLKILFLFGKISLMQQLAYRPSFFLAVLGKVLRIGVLLVFFQAIYFNTKIIAGWNFNQILILMATYLTLDFIIVITFHRNLCYYLPDLLRKGNFDFLLTKPLDTLFYTSFRVIDFFDLISSIPVLVLWYYIFFHLGLKITFLNFLLYFLLLINALIFIYSLLLIIASTSFWTITATGVGRFFENVIKVARFPTDIYQGLAKIILVYIIPISIIATIPAKTLIGLIFWKLIIFAFVFTLILLFFSLKFWKFALKHYSSASA